MKRLIMVLSFIFAVSVQADTLQIPIGQQGNQSIERPSLGMSKEDVEKRFGEPLTWSDAKGQPPISTWEYAEFKVYFESDYVIHSVLKHKAKHKEKGS